MKQSFILLSAIAASLVFFSCTKEPLKQPRLPGVTLQTTTSDLRTDSNSVSLSTAGQIARNVLQDLHPGENVSISSAETILKDGIPYMHIVNASNGKGFAILSASRGYNPVIGYSDKGYFDRANLNAGAFLWLSKHATNMDYARRHTSPELDSVQAQNKATWAALEYRLAHPGNYKPQSPATSGNAVTPGSRTIIANVPPGGNPPPPVRVITGTATYTVGTVGPLCPTAWDQNCNYNTFCPASSQSQYCYHDPTGCVPTAMAQIMRFWKVPYSVNGYVYNWNAMPLDSYSASSYVDVARLMADIGQSTAPKDLGLLPGQFVSYGESSSGADDTYCPSVFHAFGYSSASRTETVSDQVLSGAKNGVSYSSLLTNEITANQRPCMVAGNSDENSFLGIYWPTGTAHEWVCDGYQQVQTYIYFTETVYIPGGNPGPHTSNSYSESVVNYLHLNWGWSGLDNGWFDCATSYTHADASEPNFQYFQTIIYNIHP